MYIKINGSDEQYNAHVIPFTTQHGNEGIRVVGEMPETDQGFKAYEDEKHIIGDFSDYIYLYAPNEYTKVEEEIEYATCSYQTPSPSPYDKLSNRINRLSSQVNAITPYVESKNVYIGDTECVFDVMISGEISAFVVDKLGNNIPNTVVEEVNKVRVLFDELEQSATVTISIQ